MAAVMAAAAVRVQSGPKPVSDPAFQPKLQFDAWTLSAFIDQSFPAATRAGFGEIVSVAPDHVRMRLTPSADMIRPGDIVSGPTLMGLADVAAWAVVLAHVGPVAMAVTNSLSITFLRACQLEPVIADARLLKLGRRLATVDVRLWQGDDERLVAQATVGYALP
ncbi:MAG: thioesterase superfamily protein [Alphaproteobacteria bacterium]|nr:thioesterase superfamily protein [Alphaproteobacteria bacterium]